MRTAARLLLAVLVVALAAVGATYCGGGSSPSAGSPVTTTPTTTTTTTLAAGFSCSASPIAGAEPRPPVITFDEAEVAATWVNTLSSGTYANCPMRYSMNQSFFAVGSVTFTGNYTFRSLWNGCVSTSPEVWTGGVLQSARPDLTIGFPNAAPRDIRISLGIDGTFPDLRFDFLAAATSGGTVSFVSSVSAAFVGRIEVSCSQPIASLRITHNGPHWILDSITLSPASGPGPGPTPSPTPQPSPTPTPSPTASPPPTPPPQPSPTPQPGFPACPGSRPQAPCGLATGQCNDNTFTCSQNRSGTCSSHGGLKCVYCPGPIC